MTWGGSGQYWWGLGWWCGNRRRRLAGWIRPHSGDRRDARRQGEGAEWRVQQAPQELERLSVRWDRP